MTGDSNLPPDAELSGLSLEALEAQLGELEARLARLRRALKAKKGGDAIAGKPRQRKRTDVEILTAYFEECLVNDTGAVRRSARKLDVCRKTVGRTLDRSPAARFAGATIRHNRSLAELVD